MLISITHTKKHRHKNSKWAYINLFLTQKQIYYFFCSLDQKKPRNNLYYFMFI